MLYHIKESKIEELDFEEEFREISEKVGANAYFNLIFLLQDNRVYFTTIDSRSSACFGIINILSKQLEYFEDMNTSIEEFTRSVKDIKATDDHVFVHCTDNTLSIYKKE